MSVALGPDQGADLREVLENWFSLNELRSLAFDLGADFELFSHKTKRGFSLALIRCLERAGRLSCLVDQVRRSVPGAYLPQLPSDVLHRLGLPPCVPHVKVQISLPVGWAAVRVSKLRKELAACFEVAVERVVWMGAAGDGVRLLVSVPESGDGLPDARSLGKGRYQGATIRAFVALDRSVQKTWRVVVSRWPPRHGDDQLHPAVSWQDARKAARRRWSWVVAVGLVLLVVGGSWAYDQLLPWVPVALSRLRPGWLSFVREVALWSEFFASISLSLVALSWTTALLFGLLATLVYLAPGLIHFIASKYPGDARLPRVRDLIRETLKKHDRLVGTLLNLSSSGCALLVFSRVIRRPPDYWDFGIQFLIALVIELIILGVMFGRGRAGLISSICL